jgi:hypothetical protein
VNALIGEMVAATDATECTRIVTWYVDGPTYAATRVGTDGTEQLLRFERDGRTTQITLEGERPFDDDEHLVLQMPSSRLAVLTIVDTPGIDTLTEDVARRTDAFFASEPVSPVDAVLYVLQHTHPDDIGFLETFHGDLGKGSPVNSIGVLSRADEVGGGDLDALAAAADIADRYAKDPSMRRLVQTVVPVAGLLGSGAAVLRERDYTTLEEIDSWSEEVRDRAMLSVQTLLGASPSIPTPRDRADLLDLLGLFGVRLAVELIGNGDAATARQLADELNTRSGLPALRDTLRSHLADRADLLKARSALEAVARTLPLLPAADADDLGRELERIAAGAHELEELRLLDELRVVGSPLTEPDTARLELLFGGAGRAPSNRLGLDAAAPLDEIRKTAQRELAHWRRHAELGPAVRSRQFTEAAARTCEGLIAAATDAPDNT